MPQTHDITLNDVGYAVVPGSFRKRSAPPLDGTQSREVRRIELGPFAGGQGQAIASGARRGWSSVGAGPCFDGQGIEPFPHAIGYTDAGLLDLPATGKRAHGLVAGNNAYVGIGQRLYKSVALTGGTWGDFAVAVDFGTGFVISGLAYFQDDVMVLSSSGNDLRRHNTASGNTVIWRGGEKGQVGCGYAGELIYAARAANKQEEIRLSGTKWNGAAVTHTRYLDSPVLTMALYNGKVAIATKTSLWLMGGQPYPGEPDDPTVSADTSKAPAWIGDPEPLMTHGTVATGDDFTFLCSYRGRLYTWLAGRVAALDDAAGRGRWERMGPEGVRCWGGTVVGDWLAVAIEGRYGGQELWGFNGDGWWLLARRESPGMLWPCVVGGAGNRDLLLFRDGSATYDLYRLIWRGASVHTYAVASSWTSSLLDAGDATREKCWRAIGSTFAQPASRGNAASADRITVTLEYSLDDGATWAVAASASTTAASARGLTLQSAFETNPAGPPASRHLQVRVSWSSISDWAPVLVNAWVEYVPLDNAPPRRRWELAVDAGDRRVRRDGNRDARDGRQAAAALWEAWEGRHTLRFVEPGRAFWEPGHLPSLALWLKADTLSGLLDGEPVARWPDATGIGVAATQASAANRPRYRVGAQHGLPAVRFDGNDWLTVASRLGITEQPFSQFAVWKAGGPQQALMLWANSSGLLVTDFDDDVGIYSGGVVFNFDAHPFGQWRLVAGIHDGAAGSLTVDGGAPTIGDTGALAPGGDLTIGAGVAGADRWLQGDLGELVITRAALTTAERQRLEGYAAHKWGLVANLPGDHPYRDEPPLAEYRVRIEEIEERVGKPGDAGRWGQSVVALTLAEV
ncbi:MAG: hypothetical protein IT338_04775 [Thermomicrobiales bacterium]|nr:hypothetical protein [Thermomicrobiales bacterium]